MNISTQTAIESNVKLVLFRDLTKLTSSFCAYVPFGQLNSIDDNVVSSLTQKTLFFYLKNETLPVCLTAKTILTK